MVAEVVAIAGGLSISIFRVEKEWFWYFTDKPDEEPVGPYKSRWDAWQDANDTEERFGAA